MKSWISHQWMKKLESIIKKLPIQWKKVLFGVRSQNNANKRLWVHYKKSFILHGWHHCLSAESLFQGVDVKYKYRHLSSTRHDTSVLHLWVEAKPELQKQHSKFMLHHFIWTPEIWVGAIIRHRGPWRIPHWNEEVVSMASTLLSFNNFTFFSSEKLPSCHLSPVSDDAKWWWLVSVHIFNFTAPYIAKY